MRTIDPHPVVSIGLPVFNGMPFLPAALTSIREQTYDRLEIVVCDNASDDGTEDYCHTISQQDNRVRYWRFDVNAGAAVNFQRTFDLSHGAYFAWAAHDDCYHRRFVSTCLETLLLHPLATMCTPAHRIIYRADHATRLLREPEGLSSLDLGTRLHAHLWRESWYTNYGLGRRSFMARAPAPMPVWGWDLVYVWLLLMLGPIIVVDDVLHDYYRPAKSQTADTILGGVTGKPTHAQRPHTGVRYALLESLRELPLDATAKQTAVETLARWRTSRHYRHLIGQDIALEAQRMRDKNALVRAGALWFLMAAVSPTAAWRILYGQVKRHL